MGNSTTLTLPLLQYSVPLTAIMSLTTGEVPSDPQSRMTPSPALYVPPAGRAQVMAAEAVDKNAKQETRRSIVVVVLAVAIVIGLIIVLVGGRCCCW